MVPAKINPDKRARDQLANCGQTGSNWVIGLFPNCPPSVENAVFSGISVSALAKPPTDQPCGDEFTENLTFFGKFPQQAWAENPLEEVLDLLSYMEHRISGC
jgi:hypothetical protein